jgi:hypothetical protein
MGPSTDHLWQRTGWLAQSTNGPMTMVGLPHSWIGIWGEGGSKEGTCRGRAGLQSRFNSNDGGGRRSRHLHPLRGRMSDAQIYEMQTGVWEEDRI